MRGILIFLLVLVAGGGVTLSAAAGSRRQTALVIRTKLRTDRVMYIEGAIPFVSIADRRARVLVTRRVDRRVVLRLAPARYRLRSWVRPCNGNCGSLGPPTDDCTTAFTLTRGEMLTATIHIEAEHACTISFRRA